MPVAHATLALLMLANHITPRLALWNTTRDTCPDLIPRARDARATPEPPAHTVLAFTLLHTSCNNTHRSLHTTETRTRLRAPHAAALQSSSLVGREQREPASLMAMLGNTSPSYQPCIDDAGHRHLTPFAPPERHGSQSLKKDKKELDAARRAAKKGPAVRSHTAQHKNTHLNINTYSTAGEQQEMQGSGRAQAGGRGAARQGAPDPSHKKRPATVSPGSQPTEQARSCHNIFKVFCLFH